MELTIGLFAEGTTDERFLPPIIRQTFAEVLTELALDDVLVPDPVVVKGQGDDYPAKTLDAAQRAYTFGLRVLVVHRDADDPTPAATHQDLITPAFDHVRQNPANACAELVALVPVYETEAWMLADKDLLREHLTTRLTDQQLGLPKRPEQKNDPKKCLDDAIDHAARHDPKKWRRDLTRSSLYEPLGGRLAADLNKLTGMDSYQTFRGAVRNLLRQLPIA